MKNNSGKKAVALYVILSIAFAIPALIPIWVIRRPIWILVYCLFFYIYIHIAVSFATRIAIWPSLVKELDAEKYAAIVNTRLFRARHSNKLALYLATGDHQGAYNIISSLFHFFYYINNNLHRLFYIFSIHSKSFYTSNYLFYKWNICNFFCMGFKYLFVCRGVA